MKTTGFLLIFAALFLHITSMCYCMVDTTQLNTLIEINSRVFKSIKHGRTDKIVRSKDEILKSGVGICSDFSYLFMREIDDLGLEYRAVKIHSDFREAVHVVVEVNFQGKWLTFDPTYGTYYMESIEELMTKKDFREVDYNDPKTTYLNSNVLNNITHITYYYNIKSFEEPIKMPFKTVDTNLSTYKGHEIEKSLDYDATTYLSQTDDLSTERYFEIVPDQPIAFYKLTLNYSSELFYLLSFDIYGYTNGKWVLLTSEMNWHNKTKGHIYTMKLNTNVTYDKFRFVFKKAAGENRVVISDIHFYQ